MSVLPWCVAAWLLGVGLYGICSSRNYVHLIGCMSVCQSSTYVLLLGLGFRWGAGAPIFYDHPPGTAAGARGPGAQARRDARSARDRAAGGPEPVTRHPFRPAENETLSSFSYQGKVSTRSGDGWGSTGPVTVAETGLEAGWMAARRAANPVRLGPLLSRGMDRADDA